MFRQLLSSTRWFVCPQLILPLFNPIENPETLSRDYRASAESIALTWRNQQHFVNRARTLAAEHTADPNRPGRGYFADQFENEANWQAHYDSTGPEIFRQCGGKVDAFVAGAGTGGTIAGVARYLKPRLPDVKIVLADPQGSGLFNRIKYGVMFATTEKEGSRRRSQVDTIVEGIGINRVTANFEAGREWIDDAIKVNDEQALAMARWLVEKDGIFVGSSSAVNCRRNLTYILS